MEVPQFLEEELALMQRLGIRFPVNQMNMWDREERNEVLRRVLREEGLEFCDDNATHEPNEGSREWFGKRRAADAELQPEPQKRSINLGAELPMLGIAASTTDHETQASRLCSLPYCAC